MEKVFGVGAVVAILAGAAILTGYPVLGYLAVVGFVCGGGLLIRKSGAAERARLKEMFPEQYRND